MRFPILSLLALTLVGCSIQNTTEDDGETAGKAAALSDPGACPATRFIGPAALGCPTYKALNGQYKGTKLVDSTVSAIASQCVLDFTPYPGKTFDPAVDPAAVPASFDRDCNVVGALGSPVGSSPTVLGPLHDSFISAAGGTTSFPRKITGGNPQSVRVAVVDSTPTKVDALGRAVKGTYDHGFAVGRVIRELTCPSDDPTRAVCVGQVANALALPLLEVDKRDAVNGGYFGAQSDLAKAIVLAVDGWTQRRALSPATEPNRLVINLSVGWDTDRGYERSLTHAGLSWGTQTVLNALKHASCKGALIIAAAGNRSGGPSESTGAMWPAQWESMAAPTRLECREFEGTGLETVATFPPAGTYAPLVYAVGGVDATDRPLVLSRPSGMPRLVADGAEVVTKSGSIYTDNLTGTSMSTAVVTAAAAAVWGYNPSLTPAEVMNIVRAGAIDLSEGAPVGVKTATDFCLKGQVCGPRTRVTVAGAVAAYCSMYPSACESGAVQKWKNAVKPAYGGQNPSWPGGWASIDSSLAAVNSASSCDAQSCTSPAAKYYGKITQPWVGPQPGKGGCDVCGITSFGGLFLILQDNWWNQPAYLGVQTQTASYSYTVTPTQSATAYQLKGLDSSVTSAQLSFSPQSATPYATMEQVMYMP